MVVYIKRSSLDSAFSERKGNLKWITRPCRIIPDRGKKGFKTVKLTKALRSREDTIIEKTWLKVLKQQESWIDFLKLYNTRKDWQIYNILEKCLRCARKKYLLYIFSSDIFKIVDEIRLSFWLQWVSVDLAITQFQSKIPITFALSWYFLERDLTSLYIKVNST